VLLTGFGSAGAPDKASGGSAGALAPGWAPSPSSTSAEQSETRGEREVELTDLKPLLTGQLALTCRLFRALFEHMLGFMAVTSVSQGSAALVGELTGGRDQSRSFLSTAMFILGKEVDGEHLMAFMAQQGLFSMAVFEHMLQNRDYCDAFHTFRHLERAFVGTAVAEEAQLRTRLDQFHAPFGGKPCATRVFAADEEDKAQIDAHLAAADLLEALALTPWGFSLHRAVSVDSAYSFQSVVSIARHFERFAHGEATKDQANRQISDHLLAFARQFSADGPSA